jgi:hypothetical protein
MAPLSMIALGLALMMVRGAIAQSFTSVVNVSMCNWAQLRANIIRDTIYLDGGRLWWQRGMSDGTFDFEQTDNTLGTIYNLSLSTSFDTKTTNLSSIFGRGSKAGGIANNIAPNYRDGAMLANDFQFILYGGLLRKTDSQFAPHADDALQYERYQYGPFKATFQPGFIQVPTTPLTRYVTHGAAVSVPSENRAFYFSGTRGQNWGEILYPEPRANVTANTLISVDMSAMRAAKWSNATLPSNVPGRANAELVWIPVSLSGALVAIGGVANPEDLYAAGLTPAQERENNSTDPGFMRTVPVYDVANEKWYMQNTTGDYPPPLSRFCSVVTESKDRSSFNIYIYGGYDGTYPEKRPSDDVYILSLPSFTWIKVYSGTSTHGRYSHKCVKAYPDQMLVFGGRAGDGDTLCVEGGIIQVFNMNKARFEDKYDPTKWSEYKVPDLVIAKIGGGRDGGATALSPSSWADNDLKNLFETKYTKPVSIWYPYPAQNTSISPPAKPTPAPSGGLPKWVGPVIGVILGLIFITGVVFCWLLWRRRQEKPSARSETGNSYNRIIGWMHGVHKLSDGTTDASTAIGIHDEKGALSDVVVDGDMTSQHPSMVFHVGTHEALGSPVHEMQGFTTLTELPTEYNVTPSLRQDRRVSDSPFNSPVIPEMSSVSNADLKPLQPTHVRNHSSISSGPPPSIDETAVSDPGSPRPHYVSGFREHLASPEEEAAEPSEAGFSQTSR